MAARPAPDHEHHRNATSGTHNRSMTVGRSAIEGEPARRERHGTTIPNPDHEEWLSLGCPARQPLPVPKDTPVPGSDLDAPWLTVTATSFPIRAWMRLLGRGTICDVLMVRIVRRMGARFHTESAGNPRQLWLFQFWKNAVETIATRLHDDPRHWRNL